MSVYRELPPLLQTGFLTALFILLCLGLCLLLAGLRRRRLIHKLLVLAGCLLTGGLLVSHVAQLQAIRVPAVTRWLWEQPALLTALPVCLCGGYFLWLIASSYRRRSRQITSIAIKEGLDSISSGLCFYTAKGRVILSNYRMNELCHIMVGRDLQNAELFWQLLQSGRVLPQMRRLDSGSQPVYGLPDGSVWRFSCERLEDICQMTAADITQLQALADKLAGENDQLKSFNDRLRTYGKEADALTREKERLEIKTRVHRDLGQALLATKRCLQQEEISPEAAIELWHHSIALLRKEAETREEQPLQMLQRAAEATGIRIRVSGSLPDQAWAQELFIQAAAEALTNAITHAKAGTMYMELSEGFESYRVSIFNDGRLPQGPIREGGGLSSLRRKVEQQGGVMEVVGQPQFVLTITVGKKEA